MAPLRVTERIQVEAHRAEITGALNALRPLRLPLEKARGHVLAEPITAPIDLPRFDNSQMDGYAVRAADVANASAASPTLLTVTGHQAAGRSQSWSLSSGEAIRIMTGAPIPSGADAVIAREATNDGTTVVEIRESAKPGQFIRRLGDDVARGTHVMTAGHRLNARHLGLLASLGISDVLVRPRPRVAVVATGHELRRPGEALDDDAIYDGNSAMLCAALAEAGAEPLLAPVLPDDEELVLPALTELAKDVDLIITIGAISMGDHDVIKAALSSEVTFRKVAMQPGQPQGFGFLGADRTPVLCFPGNPVSSYVSLVVFGLPAVAALTAEETAGPRHIRVPVTTDLHSVDGKHQFMRGQLAASADGTLAVTPIGGHASHLMGSLAESNALISVAEQITHVAAGELVTVIDLEHHS